MYRQLQRFLGFQHRWSKELIINYSIKLDKAVIRDGDNSKSSL